MRSTCLRATLPVAIIGWVTSIGYSPPVWAVRVPIVTASCAIADFGSEDPAGMTFNANTGHLVIVDPIAGAALSVDATCQLASSFSLAALGSVLPSGIAHDPDESTFAIVDSLEMEVFFADEFGNSRGHCDLAVLNVPVPRGITFNRSDGVYAIVSDGTDEVILIDDTETTGQPCNLINRTALQGLGEVSPSSIAYLEDSAQYAIADFDRDLVLLVDTAFDRQDSFETFWGVGSSLPTGLAYDPARQRFFLVDANADRLFDVDARGTSTLMCSTPALGLVSPQGIAFNPETSELILVDDRADAVFIVDSATCTLVRQFDIAPVVTVARGIAYLPNQDLLAIRSSVDPRLHLFNYTTGSLVSQCDSETSFAVGDLEALTDFDLIAINDENAFKLVDRACRPQHQHSTRVLGDISAPFASTLAFNPVVGNFLMTGSDRAYVLNFEGLNRFDFDLIGIGLGGAVKEGLTYVRGGSEFFFVESSQDNIYHWDIPLLSEPTSLSGRYRSASGTTVVLLERGDGSLSGLLELPVVELPLYGHVDVARRAIEIGFQPPQGNPVSVSGTVSADLNQLVFPPPLGTLTRGP